MDMQRGAAAPNSGGVAGAAPTPTSGIDGSGAYVESKSNIWKVIAASSVGTLIEWYDFYIFGALSTVLATQFFPKSDPTTAFLSTLATFAAGFVVRPFGAIVFGWLGDRIGRKYTFLVTLLLMGGATFGIGLIPGYEVIGFAAPLTVLMLRLLQGLALGGEYGGAATYVAEHAPHGKRGFYTSFIQTTATLGLFVSLGVILSCRQSMSPESFAAWGWRIPFLLSIVLVIFSYAIRTKLNESPLFQRLKSSGKTSRNPFVESFGRWENMKIVLICLFGATMGQGVVWYTGQFYALTFLQKTINVEFVAANYIIAAALVVGTPFFVVFGSLSDRFGRKPVMMMGMLLAAATYVPIYRAMHAATDLSRKDVVTEGARRDTRETRSADGTRRIVTATFTETYADGASSIRTVTERFGADGALIGKPETVVQITPGAGDALLLTALVLAQVLYVTMVYGPIAAFLVELFPTRIRYTSMSLPYHIGNGVFGGLVPLVATWIATANVGEGKVLGLFEPHLSGLIYPIGVATVSLIVGMILIRERREVALWHGDGTDVGG